MRILHVIDSIDAKGGGPIEGVKQRATILTKMGHTVEVACCDEPDSESVKTYPGKVYALGPAFTQFRYAPGLRKWLLENVSNYDAVIINGIWQYHCLSTSVICKNRRVRYWIFTHGMLDPWFNKTNPLRRIRKMMIWPWQHRALRNAESVLFTAEEERIQARLSFWPYRVRERVVSYGTGRPPESVRGSQEAAFLTLFPALKGKRFLLFLSRIHPKKGCDLLLRAFNEIALMDKEFYLVMAGPVSPQYRAELDQIELAPGVGDRIVWAGMLSGEEKYGAFRTSDVFILPSHQENFGIAVAESLACAKPVLISRRINIWREIEADGAGFVAEDDFQGVLALIRNWMSLDASDRAAMSQRALACYENRFTVEGSAEDLVRVVSAR